MYCLHILLISATEISCVTENIIEKYAGYLYFSYFGVRQNYNRDIVRMWRVSCSVSPLQSPHPFSTVGQLNTHSHIMTVLVTT
jgi:hypothetical protein